MRFIKWLLFILILAVAGIWLYFKYGSYSKIDPLQLIPSDAIYIFETDQPIAQWKSFSQGPFWAFLKNQESLGDITEDANYLDSLIASNKSLLKFFGDRHFLCLRI